MFKTISIGFLLFLLFEGVVSAQPQSDYQKYINSAGRNSLLLRGKTVQKYSFFHKGTYFAYDMDYLPGSLYYNKKWYTGLYINLNSHLDEVYIRMTKDGVPVGISDELVSFFTMGDKQFVRLVKEENSPIKDGYYQILYSDKGVFLYKRIVKHYREDVDQNISIGISGLAKIFEEQITYYFFNGENYFKIRGKNDLIKHFPKQKKKINKQLSQSKYNSFVEAKNDKDGLFKTILAIVEN